MPPTEHAGPPTDVASVLRQVLAVLLHTVRSTEADAVPSEGRGEIHDLPKVQGETSNP